MGEAGGVERCGRRGGGCGSVEDVCCRGWGEEEKGGEGDDGGGKGGEGVGGKEDCGGEGGGAVRKTKTKR